MFFWVRFLECHGYTTTVSYANNMIYRNGKILPLGGEFPTTKFRIDGMSAEEALGFKFTSFEETMKGLIGQYIGLKKKEIST